MKFILIVLIVPFFLISCKSNKKTYVITGEVYYVFMDSFLGPSKDCRILIRIPIEKTVNKDIDSPLTLCFKNSGDILRYSRILEGDRKKDEFLLNVKIVEFSNKDTLLVTPYFSPVKLDSKFHDRIKYEKGITKTLSIELKDTNQYYLKFISAKPEKVVNKEAIFIK